MAFAVDQTRMSPQSSPRSGHDVDVFVVHHQASVNDDATINAMVSGSREVSANFTVSNTGRITAVVPEDRRAWTSASPVDDRALTVECANSTGAPGWGIDPRSFEAVARLIAYGHVIYGIPLQRASKQDPRGVVGHRDVAAIYGGSYATACPGNLDVDELIARAQQLVGDPNTSLGGGLSEEDDMNDAERAKLDEIHDAVQGMRPTWIDANTRAEQAVQNTAPLADLRQTIIDGNQRAALLVAKLIGQPAAQVDTAAIAAAVADALDDELAKSVADLLAKRLAA